MFTERARQAESALLKKLGLESISAAETLVKENKARREAEMTELQKAQDDRTCPSCFALHGSLHPPGEDFGSHPNCRCSPVPETYSWEEIGARYGIDLSELLGKEEAHYYKKWCGTGWQSRT